MREILFLAHRIPWPADRGDKIRSHHILKRLAQMAPVHVCAFADDARDMGFVPEMKSHFESIHVELRDKPVWRSGLQALASAQPVSVTSFASTSMQKWVDSMLENGCISHIFVFSGAMAQYVPVGFDGRFIMDFADVDSAKFESYAGVGNPFMRWINAREGRKLSVFEHEIGRRADASLFVSEAEAELFRNRSGLGRDRVVALGNGIDTAFYDPATQVVGVDGGSPLIVFTGQMDYRPNIEAVCDFATNAIPIIRKAHPTARFAIVGRCPTVAVSALAKMEGVIVTGAVDDVRSWIKAADVVVAPLRIARGIQNKVLEAMAMAKPVVASTAAAQGIDAQDGKDLLVAATVYQEAEQIIALLNDPAIGERIGKSARHRVQKHYSWAGQLAALDEIMGYHAAAVQAAPG
jgi:polysaccharide biosynthesis protein PslH